MKVVHILSNLSHSGAERQFACTYALWREAGIEPTIVGMADGEHPFAETLAAVGYPVFTLPPARTRQGMIALRRLLQQIRPEVVHIGAESAFDAVALVAISCSSVKGVVRTVHSHFRYPGWVRPRRKLRSLVTRHLGVVWVSVSNEVAATELEYSKNPTRVVEGFVDIDSLLRQATPEGGRRIHTELGIDSSAFVVGLIGNCGSPKNHELVAEALTEISEPLQLLHIGHRDHASQVEKAAWERVPARHTVHHLGARDDIPALLASCDLTLLPSLYEGLPNVAIESLCAGVPLIGADTLGFQWLRSVPHARCIPHNPKRWAEAVDAAVDSPIEVRVDALAAVRDRFRPARAVDEYRAIYEKAIDGRLVLRKATRRALAG
jgi:glycosyltransferase involved in cell wall biosynthesis